MTSAPIHTLPKAARLKSRKQIEGLFKEGKGFTAFPIKVMYRWEPATQNDKNENSALQAGVSASSRQFKHATDRNRIKRLLREVYRLQRQPLEQAAAQKGMQLSVFFIYVDKPMPEYALLHDKMRYCLKRLRKIVEELP